MDGGLPQRNEISHNGRFSKETIEPLCRSVSTIGRVPNLVRRDLEILPCRSTSGPKRGREKAVAENIVRILTSGRVKCPGAAARDKAMITASSHVTQGSDRRAPDHSSGSKFEFAVRICVPVGEASALSSCAKCSSPRNPGDK